MSSIIESFAERLRGSNTGNVYTVPEGKFAWFSVYTAPSSFPQNSAVSASVQAGGRTLSLNLNLTSVLSGSVMPSQCVDGFLRAGESLAITSNVAVSWEVVEFYG